MVLETLDDEGSYAAALFLYKCDRTNTMSSINKIETTLPSKCHRCHYPLKNIINQIKFVRDEETKQKKAPAVLQCNCLIYLCKECVTSMVIESVNDINGYHFACPLCKTITRDEMFKCRVNGDIPLNNLFKQREEDCVQKMATELKVNAKENNSLGKSSESPTILLALVKNMRKNRYIDKDVKTELMKTIPNESSQLGSTCYKGKNLRRVVFHLSRISKFIQTSNTLFSLTHFKENTDLGILHDVELKTNEMLIRVVGSILYSESKKLTASLRCNDLNLGRLPDFTCRYCYDDIDISDTRTYPIHIPCNCVEVECINCYFKLCNAKIYQMDLLGGSDANFVVCTICKTHILVDSSHVKNIVNGFYEDCIKDTQIQNEINKNFKTSRQNKEYDTLSMLFTAMVNIQQEDNRGKMYSTEKNTKHEYDRRGKGKISYTNDEQRAGRQVDMLEEEIFRGNEKLHDDLLIFYDDDDRLRVKELKIEHFKKKDELRIQYSEDIKLVNNAKVLIALMYHCCWKIEDFPDCFVSDPAFSAVLLPHYGYERRYNKLLMAYIMYRDDKFSDIELSHLRNDFNITVASGDDELAQYEIIDRNNPESLFDPESYIIEANPLLFITSEAGMHDTQDLSFQLKNQWSDRATAFLKSSEDEVVEFVLDRTGDSAVRDQLLPEAVRWDIHEQISMQPCLAKLKFTDNSEFQDTSSAMNVMQEMPSKSTLPAKSTPVVFDYSQQRERLKEYTQKFGSTMYVYLDVLDDPSDQLQLFYENHGHIKSDAAMLLSVKISRCAEVNSVHKSDICTTLAFPARLQTKLKAIKNLLNQNLGMGIQKLHYRSTSGKTLWDSKKFSTYFIAQGQTIQIRPAKGPKCLEPEGYESSDYLKFYDFIRRMASVSITGSQNIERNQNHKDINETYHKYHSHNFQPKILEDNPPKHSILTNLTVNSSSNKSSENLTTVATTLGKRFADDPYEQPFSPSFIDNNAPTGSLSMYSAKKKKKKSKRNHVCSDDENSDDDSDYL